MTNYQKTKSGKFRYRKMVDGKSFGFTSDVRLSEKKVQERFRLMINEYEAANPSSAEKMTFSTAARKYNESVEGSLSQSTLAAYRHYERYLPEHFGWFCDLQIGKIETGDIQLLITEYSTSKDEKNYRETKTRSPKTVKNMTAYVLAVLKMFLPEKAYLVKLPTIPKKEPYIPTEEEVYLVMDYFKQNPKLKKYIVPLGLAAMGLRRSEICALTAEDLDDDNMLYIHAAKVKDSDGNWHIRETTKTRASTRKIQISEGLASLIREQGYVYDMAPTGLTDRLHDAQDKLGVPRFSVHKLRHFFASSGVAENVPTAYLEKLGGWAPGSPTLKRIYTHTQDKRLKEANEKMVSHLSDTLGI